MKQYSSSLLCALIVLLLINPETFGNALAASGSLSNSVYLPMIYRPATITAWTADPGTKIQPTTAKGGGISIPLQGARRSYEAYQIVVTAGQALSGVNMTAGDLTDAAGHVISSSNFTFFREVYIDYSNVDENEPGNQPVPQNSPTGDAMLPDPLVPFVDPYTAGKAVGAPFSVSAGQNQPVWVDLYIPEDASAGFYQGTIQVTAAQGGLASIPITLTVWDLTLPDMNSLTPYFGMHVGDPLMNYHSDIAVCSGNSCWLDWDSSRTREIVKRYEALLHQHRGSTWQNFVPDPEGGECSAPTNWSDYDAAMQPYMDGSYWADGVPSAWIETPFTPGADWGLQVDCNAQQYTSVAAAWASHLKTMGWFDRALIYAADEPDEGLFDDIASDAGLIQSADADWKAHIMDTTAPDPANIATLGPALGIFNVALSDFDGWGMDSSTPADQIPYGRDEWPSLFEQGTQLWFYESNAQSAPYPTFAANTLLGEEPRIMLWGAWYEGATGFLYWDTTAWTEGDPWGANVDWGKSGDGVLVYPGNHDGFLSPAGSPSDVAIDGPIPSYRLKMVRAGLQDWALFVLAEQEGLGDYARQQVAQAYGQMGGCEWQGCPPYENGAYFWKTDEELLQQIRENIAAAIIAGQ